MSQPILALQELSKYYVNGQNVVAGLNKINLSFYRGEFVAITGESGSGKSSLAHILGGILPYEDGELYFEGKPTSHFDSADWEQYRAHSVGFISQSYGILPGATVEENVVSALRLTGVEKEQATAEAKKILEEVELWHLRSRRAAKLSSGQKQRLSIARALAKPCSILIADEPTGNLDPENSDKIIRLLAKAARDRLVILITHDFCEAEDIVTRHISLHDGRVSADARLREQPNVADAPPKRKLEKDLSGYVASLQMRSRPAWSMIMLLFTMLTAFAVFAFLGSFIVALDDTSTRVYDDSAFLNGEKERIVAVRLDSKPMTQEDYDAILAISHVYTLEKFGYIRDISYAYQEDIDWEINYSRQNYGSFRNEVYKEYGTPEILVTDQYMKTVPLMEGSFLAAGRLPQQYNEVVAAGDESLLGTQVTVYIRNYKDEYKVGSIRIDAQIVGVTDLGEGLYFHDDVGKTLTLSYLGAEYTFIPYYGEIPSQAEYVNYRDARSKVMYGPLCPPFYAELELKPGNVMRAMADDEAYISLSQYIHILTDNPPADYRAIYSSGCDTQFGKFHIAGLHGSTLENAVAVTPEAFSRILEDSGIGFGDQVSITLTDYAYAQRVIDELEEIGYYALSPYVLGATTIDPELAAQRSQTLFICIGALLAILVLQLIVLRAMYGMQTDSFRILSDMGLTFRTACKAIFWQTLAFAAAGQLLGIGGIGLCSHLEISQITAITKYLYLPWWIGICAIHIGSLLLSAWMAAAGLKKAVYPRTAGPRDLEIDEEETA